MKKNIVQWPLISTAAASLMVWWLINQKPPIDNPIAILVGAVGFGLWAVVSFVILVKNIYQVKRDDLPSWIRWIKTHRFWLSFFAVTTVFFIWRSFTSEDIGMTIISGLFAIFSAGLFLKTSWKIVIIIGESIPDPQN